MIHPFNSRELIYTTDMTVYNYVRDILEENRIDYVRNPFFATWYRSTQPQMLMEYIVYVKKKDYANAAYLIRDAYRRR